MGSFSLYRYPMNCKTEESEVCYFNESMTTWCMMLLYLFVLFLSLLLKRHSLKWAL